MLDSILTTGSAAYHFGNAIDLSAVLSKLPEDVLVMGNVDPAGVMLMGTPDIVRDATVSLLNKCSVHKNFLLSSGCDIPPRTPWENIDAFFESAESFYKK